MKNFLFFIKSNFIILPFLFFFFIAYHLGFDFGAFEDDYSGAHSITMLHLHEEKNFIELLKTIPNSASGVLPLWLFGFFETYFMHKLISIFIFFIIIFIIWYVTRLNEYGRYFTLALLTSPMIISGTAWAMPEIFGLFITILVFSLTYKQVKSAIILSALVPLARQTFIVLLFGRVFFEPKNLKAYIMMCLISGISLILLIYIWQGLVPPNLTRHYDPSIKASIIALLIFSMYFFYDNLINFYKYKSSIDPIRLIISIIVAITIVLIGINQPPLAAGGYFFSRLEIKSLILTSLAEILLLSLFFYQTKLNTIFFTIFASLSFITTNVIFLKYIDFYFFCFLAYGISDVNKRFKNLFTSYAKSCFMFQIFSIITAFIYYYIF
jgi:hypothetical protein